MVIGIIDSGIGGLTVLKEIDKIFKGNSLCYFADTENFPYGEKDRAYLQDRLFNISLILIKNYNVEMIVLACNTATTNALEFLSKMLPIPVFGVEPNIPIHCNGKIVVVATKATYNAINSTYLSMENKVKFYVDNNLAFKIERDLANVKFIAYDLAVKISSLKPDIIVLGCTHYVYLSRFLKIFYKRCLVLSSIDTMIDKMRKVVKKSQNSQKNYIKLIVNESLVNKYNDILKNI